MVNENQTSVLVNGNLARAKVLSALVKDVVNAGVSTVLLFVIFGAVLGAWSGWLPSPYMVEIREFNTLQRKIAEEMQNVTSSTRSSEQTLRTEIAVIRNLCISPNRFGGRVP